MLQSPVTFSERGLVMADADEIKKARKEWDTLIWKQAILQALKRQGFNPEFVQKLESSFKSSRESFFKKYGKYVEWL